MNRSEHHYSIRVGRHDLNSALVLIESLSSQSVEPAQIHVVCLDEFTRTVLGVVHPTLRLVALHQLEQIEPRLSLRRGRSEERSHQRAVAASALLFVLRSLPNEAALLDITPDGFLLGSPDSLFNFATSALMLQVKGRLAPQRKEQERSPSVESGALAVRHDLRGIARLERWNERLLASALGAEPCLQELADVEAGSPEGDVIRVDAVTSNGAKPVAFRGIEDDGRRDPCLCESPLAFFDPPAALKRPVDFPPSTCPRDDGTPVRPIAYIEALARAARALEQTDAASALALLRIPLTPENPKLEKPPMNPNLASSWHRGDTAGGLSPQRNHAQGAGPSRRDVLKVLANSRTDVALMSAIAAVNGALAKAFSEEHLPAARAWVLEVAESAFGGRTTPGPQVESPSPRDALESSAADRVAPLANAIRNAVDAGDLTEAERCVKVLMAELPADADVRLTSGHIALRRGDLPAAEAEFVRASVLARAAEPATKADVAEAFVELAEAWRAEGEEDHRRLAIERALRIDPNNAAAAAVLAGRGMAASAEPTFKPEVQGRATSSTIKAWFAEGEAAAGRGDWARAADVFANIVNHSPGSAAAHVGLASSAFALGQVDRGFEALRRACELEPENESLHMQHAALLLQTGKFQAATEAFAAMAERLPNSIEARLGLAESYRLDSRPLQAIDVLDRAHQAFPTEPSVIAAIGSLASELGDRQSAMAALATIEAMAPQHPRTMALREALAAPIVSTGT